MYTYLIFDPFSRLTKIGRSKNPKKRFDAIKTANPCAELFYYSTSFTEKELHKRFEHKKHTGEWFELDKNDLISITGSYSSIPKRLHYSNTKKDIARKDRNKRLMNLTNIDFKYFLRDHPNYKFTEQMAALYNTRTGNKIRMMMNGRSKGYCINGKFKSINSLRKELEVIPEKDTPF